MHGPAGHTHGDPGPGDGSGDRSDRAANKRALGLTLALTSAFTAAEIVGGLVTGSLALLADAGHMLSDDLSLGLALFAVWLAERPADLTRTFGYKRAEILAALANGVTLVVISIWIFYEAYGRLEDPPEILGGWMLAVAGVGLAVNVVAARILHRSAGESLNLSAAFRHVLADLLGSVGVMVAAIVILLTGWVYADPLISVLIGILIIASSWTIIRDSVRILLEATPRGLDLAEVVGAMTSVPGVLEVHDLHAWEVTSGFPALSAHVIVKPEADCHHARFRLAELLERRFEVRHSTLQVEHKPDRLLEIASRSPAPSAP